MNCQHEEEVIHCMNPDRKCRRGYYHCCHECPEELIDECDSVCERAYSEWDEWMKEPALDREEPI